MMAAKKGVNMRQILEKREAVVDRSIGFLKCWQIGLFVLLGGLQVFAQLEPCGFYERDGVPGYGEEDFFNSVSFWLEEGSQPALPDFDGNGVVDVRDLIKQTNCVGDLSRGLLGSYYGFQDSTDEEDITFSTLDNRPLDQEPTIVLATESLEDLSSTDFLDSNMRYQFGAIYEGFLFVPETANYTMHIFGNRGMRFFMDGNLLLSFDGSPRTDEETVPLEYGLHPIRVEFYSASNSARILLDWSSDGSVIGSTTQTIGPDYLFHTSGTIPENTQTDLKLYFEPSSGQYTNLTNASFKVFGLGPDSDLTLYENDVEIPMEDGMFQSNKSIAPGLNSYEYRLVDSTGRETFRSWHVYRDAETRSPGLVATLYATETYELMPKPETLFPFDVQVNPGTALIENNGQTSVGNRLVGRGTLVEMEGLIHVTIPGEYRFRISGNAGLWVNGEQLAGIWVNYPGEYDSRGDVELPLGWHHYRVRTYRAYGAPTLRVYWQRDDQPEVEIPNSAFAHNPALEAIPARQIKPRATGGRYATNLVAEYLFQPGQTFQDSSGNGFHLNRDPRAFPRMTGGLTYQNGGSMFTEQGGVFAVSEAYKRSGVSLEGDFMVERPIDDYHTRYVVSLSPANYGYLARISVVNNDIRFRVWDGTGGSVEAEASNVVQTGVRYHVVGVATANDIKLYLDGTLVDTQPISLNFALWPTLANFNVGQRYDRNTGVGNYDEQMIGTFYAAAIYGRAMSGAAANDNYQANKLINPTLGPLPAPGVEAFPPPGTTANQLDEAHHILNRLSFGPSADSLRAVLNLGVAGWINQQLNPNTIDDSDMESLLADDYFRPVDNRHEFRAWALFRMIYSKRQLLEVMTQFWENHFNTQLGKTDNVIEELAENQQFRQHAFGNFLDLLKASAENYPMTVYLDSLSNVVGAPNENYAREILELHCYGVNNGYTQADIVEAARCFTGWTIRRGKFFFNPGYHDYGEKQLLGITIPAGGGYKDAIMLMEHLVQSQETADFITWKLCQLLVDDDPPADVLAAASATFKSTNGDISQVLETILNHARFRTDTNFRGNKTKTPLEFLASAARATESFPLAVGMVDYLENMGMEMFEEADPTGYEEAGVAWIDTNSLLNRWNLVNDVCTNRGDGLNFGVNIKNFIQRRGLTTANDILDYFEAITTHGTEAPGVRAIALDWLTESDPGSFILDDETLDTRVRQTLSLYLRLAEFNKQ